MPNIKKHPIAYKNDLNAINLNGLSETQMNIFFTLLERLQYSQDNTIKIELNELYELAQIPLSTEFRKSILERLKVLQNYTFMYDPSPTKTAQLVILPYLEIDSEQKIIKAEVMPQFKERYLTSDFGKGKWTKYDLMEFVYLPSTYTKTIYRFLKQWRTQGKWEISYNDFKDILGIPHSYQASDIDKQIIKPSIKVLSEITHTLFDTERTPFENLKCEKIKKGRKIETLIFTFKPQYNKEPQQKEQTIATQEPQKLEPIFIQRLREIQKKEAIIYNNQEYFILKIEKLNEHFSILFSKNAKIPKNDFYVDFSLERAEQLAKDNNLI
ncbi:replication initiation protein [Campylobacter coli]|nr:replication initiation protein [Campylobacter coli]